MESGEVIKLVFLIILMGLSAFFSSAETALTTVNRIKILSLSQDGSKRAVRLLAILDEPAKMLSAILIGNNIVNLSASSLVTTLTISLFGNRAVGLATGILTLFILIFGEITPKTMAAQHSEKFALRYSGFLYQYIRLLTPVIFIVGKLSDLVTALFGVDNSGTISAMTEDELRTIMDVSRDDGVIEREEHQMISNVFDFGDSCARDVMTPRIDMTFVNVNDTYRQLLETFSKDGYTRFPVYEDSTDNVIGIINIKDLILYERKDSFSVRDILREVYFTYEQKNTASLMLEMRRNSTPAAIVLDEYGATAGLITLEDLLEEIVGEIRDEYDQTEKDDITPIIEGREYRLLGAARLDDINEELGTDFTSQEYDSIGGYFIEQIDRVPTAGEMIIAGDGSTRLIVESVSKNRIESIRLSLANPVKLAQ